MTATPPIGLDPIAERELEYRDTPDAPVRKAVIRIGRPRHVPPPPGEEDLTADYWVCPYEITIEEGNVRSSHAYGADSIQALQLAISKIGVELRHLFPGHFTMDGNSEIGFPVIDNGVT
ncbi:DUF6968 family protein [Polyangium fumosum]|uniref:DUF6968 domain-containing protein n=1 Tax=Polyangium fumosum TaxID=889272 RepID=A0A4U1IMJ9_9BACT|nr:hypothetical protein [Polyangium fumosum]TKC95253.1 hypothetical protein E8A74_47110 [Polyangium fumosum]